MIIPVLKLDSKEEWQPVAVEDTLARLGYSWEHTTWVKHARKVSRLDFPRGMAPKDFADLPVVCYHRVAQGGRLHWHQFWTWWPYNPKNYGTKRITKGEHEGDWELVQLGCKDPEGDDPVLATYSQHGGGERRHYWDVSLTDGKQGAPIVYVARDSHANYFTTDKTVTDTIDGKGKTIETVCRDFGPWAQWPGQWGNSANSPGPLSTRRAWRAPHAWHSQARG